MKTPTRAVVGAIPSFLVLDKEMNNDWIGRHFIVLLFSIRIQLKLPRRSTRTRSVSCFLNFTQDEERTTGLKRKRYW